MRPHSHRRKGRDPAVCILVACWIWVPSVTAQEGKSATPSAASPADASAAAERIFADVYGKESEAAAKAKPVEKVKFAKKLAEAAAGVRDNPALVRVLRQKAVEFAMAGASGHAVALDLRRAQAADPELRASVLPELVSLLERAVKTEVKAPVRRKLADELLADYRELTAGQMEKEDAEAALALIAKAKAVARAHLPAADSRDLLRDYDAEEKDVRRRQQLLDAASKELAVLRNVPTDPKANLSLALIRLNLGKEPEAGSCFQQCEAQPLRRLGDLLAKNPPASDFEVGDAFRAAADVVPAEKELLLSLARVRYERALENDPKNVESSRVRLLIGQLPKRPETGAGRVTDSKAVVELFEDDRTFIENLSKRHEVGTGKVSIELKDRHSGSVSLRVEGMMVGVSALPGWNFEVVENPKPGQYRFIRFAWKKPAPGSTSIMIQLYTKSRGWENRYLAGKNGPGWAATSVADATSADWVVVTRDLFKDFGGPMVITGIAFTPMDGQPGLFDHLYLGRTLEDLNRIRVRK